MPKESNSQAANAPVWAVFVAKTIFPRLPVTARPGALPVGVTSLGNFYFWGVEGKPKHRRCQDGRKKEEGKR